MLRDATEPPSFLKKHDFKDNLIISGGPSYNFGCLGADKRLSYRAEKDGSRPGHWMCRGPCDAPIAQVTQGIGGRGGRHTAHLPHGAT